MAFTTSNGRTQSAIADSINITPLVDVVLVLLIIFMGHVLQSGIDVSVPRLAP